MSTRADAREPHRGAVGPTAPSDIGAREHAADHCANVTAHPFVREVHVAFRTLLYRYFFFGWLFRDVNRGNLFERAAAWRHNQTQARWLPTYMLRWFVLGVLLYLGGLGVEHTVSTALSSVLYMPWVLSVSFNATTLVAWAGLKSLPGPAP